MTDNNEQIMIDTNKYFVELIDEGGGTVGYTVVFPERLLIEIIKQNKQLARKTQELEQYKASKQASYEALRKQCNELELKNRKLKQECEALKSEGFTRESLITEQESEIDRYRKALEEVEEYCNNVLSFTATRTTEEDILNIINKAEGEGNEY